MSLPQFVTAEEVTAAVKKAYLASKLLAQRPSGAVACEYEARDGRRCAVGVVLNDEALKSVKRRHLNNQAVSALLRKGILNVPGPTTERDAAIARLCNLQALHDGWAQKVAWYGLHHDISRRCEREFAEALGINTKGQR